MTTVLSTCGAHLFYSIGIIDIIHVIHRSFYMYIFAYNCVCVVVFSNPFGVHHFCLYLAWECLELRSPSRPKLMGAEGSPDLYFFSSGCPCSPFLITPSVRFLLSLSLSLSRSMLYLRFVSLCPHPWKVLHALPSPTSPQKKLLDSSKATGPAEGRQGPVRDSELEGFPTECAAASQLQGKKPCNSLVAVYPSSKKTERTDTNNTFLWGCQIRPNPKVKVQRSATRCP